MKRFLIASLIISIAFNIAFLYKKIKFSVRENEENKLYFYKKISHKEGYDYFLKQFKKSYPETNLTDKYFIVYMWDSLLYDFIFRDQMKTLDSMAVTFGKYKLEYVFATEMEEGASKDFLKRSYDAYKNVKMLYGMDDYISGLYSIPVVKMNKSQFYRPNSEKNNRDNQDDITLNFKQKVLYLIMNPEGKILYTNENRFMIVKDTAFLRKLRDISPEMNRTILN